MVVFLEFLKDMENLKEVAHYSMPAQFLREKLGQTPQWILGQNPTACQFFHIWTSFNHASKLWRYEIVKIAQPQQET